MSNHSEDRDGPTMIPGRPSPVIINRGRAVQVGLIFPLIAFLFESDTGSFETVYMAIFGVLATLCIFGGGAVILYGFRKQAREIANGYVYTIPLAKKHPEAYLISYKLNAIALRPYEPRP